MKFLKIVCVVSAIVFVLTVLVAIFVVPDTCRYMGVIGNCLDHPTFTCFSEFKAIDTLPPPTYCYVYSYGIFLSVLFSFALGVSGALFLGLGRLIKILEQRE